MTTSASFSTCMKYRYTLTRSIPQTVRWVRPIAFFLLNPSTATADIDDPTIRRCKSFAAREGASELVVVNLFAWRATDPAELKKAELPIGKDNDDAIAEALRPCALVIAGWGAHPFAEFRALEVTKRFGPFKCLGRTKKGAPRHPLYVRADQPLEDYP